MKMVLPVDGYHSAAAFMAAMQGSRGDTHWLMKQAEHWHGGIHLYDSFADSAICKPGRSGLKSMTDGHVVAWRLNDDYQTAAFRKKRLKFSSTFLLIKSTCTPDSARPDNGLDFYTLWMQIAPLSEYGVTGVRTATVTAGTLKIRQDNTFPGWVRNGLSEGISVPRDVLRHYEVPEDTHTTLPRGTVVEIKQEATFLLKGRPAPFIFVSVVSVPEGAKSGLSAGESGWISGLARFVKRHEDILPAWMQAARKHGVFNQVVTVSGENAPVVKAGEVIGHLSLCERPHGAPEHFCHLEVFSQDARMKSFLANAAGVTTGMTELHTLAGRTRWMYREREKTFIVAGVDGDPSPSTAEHYTPEGECRRLEADGKSWYHIPGELAWMAAEDVEKVNQFELEKRGFMPLEQEDAPQSIFQTPKEGWLRQVFGRLEALARSETRDMYSASYTERYQRLLKQMDENRDGVIDAGELWRFLHNSQPHIRYQVERLVVKHHSEWLKDGMSALWQAALDEQAKKYPDTALYNRDFINALVWMKEVPEIRSGEALWHVHPIVFLDAIAEKFSDTINFETSLGLYRISRKSANLILYAEGYQNSPYVPKGSSASGVTIGYGYDLGQQTTSKMKSMLSGYFTTSQITRLEKAIGLKGNDALDIISSLSDITISKEDAVSLAMKMKSKYAQIVVDTYPEVLTTHPHCQGAMLSLVINRGTSFNKPSVESRIEMKNIHDDFLSGNLNDIPNQFRLMKRLWVGKGLDGLITRREHEAKLFEEGLSQ
ncbi:pesticin C-terminus-like muramidase [Pantoea anthophila]|uniref:pesticin C-terminus-like muramidase n=1 Tax=Pantoea anthophila TaxID=470931 RepID=UPI00277DE743|nr:pesticin C-terminus-like muramidase [Pantoea anthophila]MDQ1212381.1 GH24 family phage-related lysozyme (muramidase) [Pantoea anthophila]